MPLANILQLFSIYKTLNHNIFYLHIPKTGGTAVRHAFIRVFGKNTVYPNQRQLKNNNGSYPDFSALKNEFEQASKNKIYFNHQQIDNFKLINENTKYITFLRDPIERTISHIYHLHRAQQSNLNLTDFITINRKRLNNIQSRYLGYKPKLDNKEEVYENIDSKFIFIGIVEDMQNELIRLSKILGIRLKNHKINVGDQNYKLKYKLSSQNLELVNNLNTFDEVFYDYVKSKNLNDAR